MLYIRKILIAAGLSLGCSLYGQTSRPEVHARFSADSVLIGDHFQLRVEVSKDVMEFVEFPTFEGGKLVDSAQVEILREGPVDTLRAEGRKVTLGKEYTLTSFDEGNYHMGRFPVMFVGKNTVDTLWSSDSLNIFVKTIPVDTLSQKIHDVKAPLQTPLRFGEFGGYLLRCLLTAIAVGIIVWIIVKRFRKKPLLGGRSAPADPPHVAAIRQLEKLHAQKLWQSGKQKAYYTAMTDILREYIGSRYPIKAMEMTSQEILDHIVQEPLDQRSLARLRDVLYTADFVKFAKYVPDGDSNEEAYSNAYYFVEETKLTEAERPVAAVAPTITEEEVKP